MRPRRRGRLGKEEKGRNVLECAASWAGPHGPLWVRGWSVSGLIPFLECQISKIPYSYQQLFSKNKQMAMRFFSLRRQVPREERKN